MAKLKQGIFGPITGKLGSLVGSSWMGIPYIKKTPRIDKNRKRTPAQIANNEKFAYVNDWMVPFHTFILVGFSNLASSKTALGACLSAIYKTVFTDVMPNLIIDHSKMQISSGTLRGLDHLKITSLDGNIYMSWKDEPGKSRYDEQVMLALYSEELHETDGFIGNVNRSANGFTFPLQPEMIGKDLHIYVAVVSPNRKKSSNTSYLGKIKTL